ncbi:hypothetical protein HAX54_020872 [Datura stramonium]|uniref:Uncharacterized protein n=1 Tax=Datura stramonium TaxID=4076 RepID=A0ABS8UTQ7_DATST|nr:hypothetical protein [Datura stramonium]
MDSEQRKWNPWLRRSEMVRKKETGEAEGVKLEFQGPLYWNDRKRDTKYLTTLEGASERLPIFNADMNKPRSFAAAIAGCVGVFHLAQPMDFEDEEIDETKVKGATLT